jgi:hypothetical protein
VSYRLRAIVTLVLIIIGAAVMLEFHGPRKNTQQKPHTNYRQVRPPGPPALSGRVVLAGQPAPGAKVSVKHGTGSDARDIAATLSDGNGHYAIAALASDPDLVVTAFYDTDFTRPKSRTYPEAIVSGTPATLDLDLALAAEIDGVVVDAHGAPVPFARIETHCIAHGPGDCPPEAWSNFPSKGDGTFALGGLGGGTISFTVRPDGKTSGPAFAPASGHALQTVELATEATHVSDIKLAVDPTRPLE